MNEIIWTTIDNINKIPNYLSGIYRLTCYDDNKSMYIGKTNNIRKRLRNYENLRCEKQIKLFNKLKEYNDFSLWKIDIIEMPIEKNIEAEIFLIKYYDTYNNGLNCTIGGEGIVGIIKTDESVNKTTDKISFFYNLINIKTFETHKVRGARELNLFLKTKPNTHNDIVRIINTLEYLISDWRIINNGIIVKPTWKTRSNATKFIKKSAGSGINMSNGKNNWYEIKNLSTNEIINFKGIKNVAIFFNILLHQKGGLREIKRDINYYNSEWRIIKNNNIVNSTYLTPEQREKGKLIWKEKNTNKYNLINIITNEKKEIVSNKSLFLFFKILTKNYAMKYILNNKIYKNSNWRIING